MTSLHTIADPETADPHPAVSRRPPEHHEMAHEILAQLGDKWSLLILRTLDGSPVRFTQLQRRISQVQPISSRILTLTLRNLERNGLITRKVFAVVPPRVEYSPTPLGAQFLGLGIQILHWVNATQMAFKAAHARFDARATALRVY